MTNENDEGAPQDATARTEKEKWRRAMRKSLEGRELAKELAAGLNYNLTHDVDDDRRILPEPEERKGDEAK